MANRVLVIDDDDQVRDMLTQMLRRAGFEVESACDGREGLRVHTERPFDVVITDLIMPEQEGLETIMQLRKLSPAVKIVAISGGIPGNSTDFLPVAKLIGADRALAKPIDRQDLIDTIHSVLEE